MLGKIVLVLVALVPLMSVLCEFNCNSCKCVTKNDYVVVDCSKIEHANTLETLENRQFNFKLNIVELNLNKLSFKILPGYVFANANINAGKMRNININSCGIQSIDKDAFRNLTGLEELNAAYNEISHLTVGTFKDNWKLMYLDLGFNKLEILADGLLDNSSFLRKVSFQNNRIKKIGDNFFIKNFNLEMINLSQNNLTYMKGAMLLNLRKLKTLTICQNPWICDCKLQELRKMSLKYDINEPKCNNTNTYWGDTGAILECPPEINLSYEVDDSLTKMIIFCEVTSYPKANFEDFYKINETNINRATKKQVKSKKMTYSYSITIADIYSELNNTYECLSQNSKDTTRKNITIMEIYSKLVGSQKNPILKLLDDRKSVTFDCIRFTFKNTKISWYFQNHSIQNDHRYHITSKNTDEGGCKSSLTIQNVQSVDNGIYWCTNPKQNEAQFFQLSINVDKMSEFIFYLLLFTILVVILLVTVIIILLYSKCYRKKQNKSLNAKEMSQIKSENEYEPNVWCMVDSNIYISSDYNVYEDIK